MRSFFFAVLLACISIQATAQISIPNSNPVTQDFNGIGTGANAPLPANWKMSGAGLGTTANWADAGNFTTTSQAANSGSPTAGGRYNWGTQFGNDRAIGFMTDGSYASPNSIMAHYRNTSGATIAALSISFNIERYRTNTNTFSLAFFTSSDGVNWTARTAGDIASNVFPTGNSAYNFLNPTSTSRNLTINNLNLPDNGDIYLRWVFTNTSSVNSQGMGLDNVSVSAAVAPLPNPNLPISCPYDFIFVLDESGSITGQGGSGATDISASLRTAAKDLMAALNGTGTRVAVVEFGSTAARGVVGGSTAYQVVDNTYITNFNTYMGPDNNSQQNANNYDPEDGSAVTNWEAAFNLVNTINTNDGIADLVIFLTDGNPTAYTNAQGGTTSSTTDPVVIAQALAEATVAANNVKVQGSHIFVVAIPNPSVLETNIHQISDTGRYPDIDTNFVSGDYSISSSETLRDDLQRIAQSVCKVDLNLAKASVQSACSGDTIVFTLVLTNNGLDNDTNVVVTDVIPSGYTYISDNGGNATTLNGNTLTWNIPTLGGGGASTSLQITAVMNPTGNYTNTASAVGTQQDVDLTNNNASFTVNLALNCDDGDPCTTDFCRAGVCVHENTCCLTNEECADNDLCTIDTCAVGACQNLPINCNDNNLCTIDTCLQGQCINALIVCTDQNLCTIDRCDEGECIFTPLVCIDQNPCTTDSCINGQCIFTPILCNDQNACTTDSCVNGTCVFTPVICDDQNSCTNDACVDGRCVFTDIVCNDQSLCTTDACVDGQCVFTPITCNDQNACTTDGCNPQTGCTTTPVVCNDGDLCTTDDCNPQTGCTVTPIVCNDQNLCTLDTCLGGQCVFTAIVCDDQNLCTTDTCIQGQCRFNGVICNDQNLCTTDACDDGECIFTAIICNDQSLCTTDACDDGECVFTAIICNDQNACTADACNPTSGCTFTVINCNDQNACTADACDIQTGCTNTGINCDDQNACTIDNCTPETGCVYTTIVCNDQNACTADVCNPTSGCVFTPITCNDQNACTIDACDIQTGCTTTPVNCDDQNACTTDNCNPSTGCVYTNVVCNDQSACTSDRCDEQIGCIFTTVVCDDENACTADACLPAIGCINSTIICNDGSACTTDACDTQIGCVFTTITCVDGDACTTDDCNPQTGCTFTTINCNDNNACTTDACDAQTGCVYTGVVCGDNNACTDDICLPQLGCRYVVINCNDGNACTNDGCNTVRGCVHNVVNCNDQNACTTDGCDPASGCFYAQVNCNDSNPCTQDSCSALQGCFYFPTDCNDNDPCTVDGCDSQTGCTNIPLDCADTDLCTIDKCLDGICAHIPVTCNDGDACTNDACVLGACAFIAIICDDEDLCTNDYCLGGSCVFEPVSCDDQNPCTEDFCVNDACQHRPIQGCCLNNQECDDQNPCTEDLCNGFRCYHVEPCCNDDNPCTYDFCLNGICVATGIFCDDGDLCTQNLCENGICFYPQINCSDNDACTIDGCIGEGICTHTPVICNDGDACTTDFCDQNGTCQYMPVLCDDLNFCTTDICIQGQCLNTPITCVDGDLCTEDFCVEGICVFLPVECEDNDVCTFDICVDGACTHPAISCDDNDFCTIDACGPNGCFYTPVICNDDDLCTVDRCLNGACQYFPQECSDGNLCTYDICVDGICSYPAVVCDDGIVCTQDACVNGQCVSTPGQIDVTIQKTDMSCGCVNPNQLCLLNFAGLPSGTILSEQYAAYGIHISAQANFPGKNFAIIFDSYATGTPDPDLEVDYGNLMVIARDVIDINPANGLVDKPNDNSTGGTITLLFDYPRTIESFDFIDEEEPGTFVFAYDVFDNLLGFVPVPAGADASIQTIPFAVSGVRKLVFSIEGSGAITNIVFGDCCCDGSAVATATGGTEPYTFAWSNGIFGNSIEELCPDEYCVTVTDANGCFAVSCIEIVQGGTGCDDGDSCTVDECVNSACVNTPIPGCEVAEPCTSEITGYTLVYESTLGEIGPLVNGQVINRDELCRFNIRADFCGDQISSVKFILNGSTFRVENDVPYALAGDNPTWDYHVWIPAPGNYTMTAIPYSQNYATGTAGISLTINFTVIDNTPNENENCVNPPIVDCNGDVNGTAFIDACGFCVWGNTGIPPNSLCPCDEEVQIVVDELPALCQGSTLSLRAVAPGASSYLWSTGETTLEIAGVPDAVYSVTATNAFGCAAVDTQTTPPVSSLLSAYVMLAENTIVLDKNKVFLGGAGARSATGSITLDDNTQVTTPNTFVRAANIVVQGGSNATSQFNAPANIALPVFESNIAVGGSAVAVPANTAITLNSSVYTTITIDSNSTVTFTDAEIDLDSIITGKNVTIRFESACVKLRLRGAFLLGENNDFNADTTAEVKIFVEGNAVIGGRTKIIADIYTLSALETLAGISTDYTTMIGFYIATSITGGEYTAWHWNPTCGCSGSGGPRGDAKMGGVQQLVVTQQEDKVLVRSYPNPFSEKLNVEFSLPEDSKARLDIFSSNGKKIATLFDGQVNAAELRKVEYNPTTTANGLVLYRLQTNQGVYYGKAVMVKE